MSLLRPESLRRAIDDPECLERFSVLTGEPVLAVDLSGRDAAVPAPQRLGQLPAVTVGVGAQGKPRPGSLAAAVDLQLAGEKEVDALREAVSRSPLACLALVQLLRLGEGRSAHEGLVAESLVYSTLQAGPEFARWLQVRRHRDRPEPGGPALRVWREGDVLRMRLDRPEKRNAFSSAMRDGLCEALALLVRDESLCEARLDGAGPSFCSGGDLDEFGSLPDPATAHAIRSTRNPGRLLLDCGARVRAHVHGACVGAGAEIPAFCGRVVSQADAFFQLPEVGLGLVPGAGGTVSLPRRIGRQRTAWLALTGARIDAETALEWGLVDELERS